MRSPRKPGITSIPVGPQRTRQNRANESMHFKDQVLDRLAQTSNVAQFVSFSPGLTPSARFAHIRGIAPNYRFASIDKAIEALLDQCADQSVNVRSFDPQQPKAHDFIYGIAKAEIAALEVRRLAADGLHTIVNETIDVNDGGVSGVSYAGLLEFAPGDTPRAVEKPGTASLPRALGLKVLESVYGFRPSLDHPPEERVEFSLHPLRRGTANQHTVIWEVERAESLLLPASVTWPNRFSRFIGDKAFGLLIAAAIELPVPLTTVVSRGMAPFTFGRSTGSHEFWIRTCPREQMPGKFTTRRGWLDPFRLMSVEDPEGNFIASILAQEGVDAKYSGATVAGADGQPIVEGVLGSGEDFMQGRVAPQALPSAVVGDVLASYASAAERLGAVRFEWVHDGRYAWIVQLHTGATVTEGNVIYPGSPSVEHQFPVENGLESLRALAAQIEGTGEGIVLVGQIGVTSHLGDILRRARIPSRVQRSRSSDTRA